MTEENAVREAIKHAGSQQKLAENLTEFTGKKISQGTVTAWLKRSKKLSPDMALPVHELTNGGVSAHDSRPDLYPREKVQILIGCSDPESE